jgi:predicted hotdog family 3-hydroxylacyl-ACP dehydratase
MDSPAPSSELLALVAHRGPMLLLDSVTSHGERAIACTASIGDDHAFLDDGKVDVLLCIELVAQAVAAYVGHRDLAAGRAPKIGFLVSCREASFEVPALLPGDALAIEARHVWGDGEAGSFKGTVSRGGLTIATVELGVYRGSLDAVMTT